MSEQAPIPALKVFDAEPVGYCEPGSDYCEVAGAPDEPAETNERDRIS